ncbi:TetR family transcriptional regulator [Reyranella sp. CPCC 100927]|uniref:TetR family transcriptional regulator n=1 Tax=Reyranella sp. CPCC 100927 TaxID=2599616 RepID=UPI0011B50D36|nr:TetR family transcriptional regulator [Reyranella sp. CPCC 100927]TWT03211.1 TetR family transcriptional regulator [Reyranella sp. CPCC 100927]
MADRAAILSAFLTLLAEKGWRGFALRDVAAAADASLADVYVAFPSRMALIEAFLADIDRQVLAGVAPSLDPDETVRDRLFDAMMRRYDALQPHKAAVASLSEGLLRDPLAALSLSRALGRSMAAVLEAAGVSADGAHGALRQRALAAIHLAVMRVWLKDDSADQSKTMAALDHRLKRAEHWARSLDRFSLSARRRRTTAADSGDAPEAGASEAATP